MFGRAYRQSDFCIISKFGWGLIFRILHYFFIGRSLPADFFAAFIPQSEQEKQLMRQVRKEERKEERRQARRDKNPDEQDIDQEAYLRSVGFDPELMKIQRYLILSNINKSTTFWAIIYILTGHRNYVINCFKISHDLSQSRQVASWQSFVHFMASFHWSIRV